MAASVWWNTVSKFAPSSPDSTETEACTMCSQKAPPVSRCLTCHQFMCHHCDQAHKGMYCFLTHTVLDLTVQPNKKSAANDSKSKLKKCSHHDGEDLLYVCVTCDYTMICMECVELLHQNHAHETIFNAEMKVKETLSNHLIKAQKNLDDLVHWSCMIEKGIQELSKNRVRTITTLKGRYEKYQDILRKERDEVIRDVERDCHVRQQFMVERKVSIDSSIEEFARKMENIKSILGQGGLEYGPRLNGCATALVPHKNREDDSRSFTLLLDEISSYCLNEDLPPSLPTTTSSVEDYDTRSSVTSTTTPDSPPTADQSEISSNQVNSMQLCKTFGQKGSAQGQFNSPHGFCFGFDEDIVVADTCNHRVQVFDNTGCFKFQFGNPGRHDGQLWYPRKIVFKPVSKKFVVCDRGFERSRMQIFTEDGRFVRKIYIQYIDIVAGMAVNSKEEIVVVDSVTPTIFVIGKNEYLRSIDCSSFMEEPSDITVIEDEYYICDFKGHNIAVVDADGNCLRKIGSKTITTFPNGIDVSSSGDIVIGDSHGNFFHISIFTKEGEFLSEFRCPFLKVSRCCGLKITSEGYLITVDKNFHHIIVLDTLYITPKANQNQHQ